MNRCPNCAAQNREGAKFCTSCGFRLPTESTPVTTSERSPFATTSTVPPYADSSIEPLPAPDRGSGFGTWNLPPQEEHTPGLSWDSAPPPDTSVPVNDDMIASLVGDAQSAPEEELAELTDWPTPTQRSSEGSAPPAERRPGGISPTFDHLLKLVRDLEYELVEMADTSPVSATGDSRLLANALADLQDDDDLAPLRTAIATAQDRPRDVDVMLDLVLRADAISAVLVERDQLKSAISLFLAGSADRAEADESSRSPVEELGSDDSDATPSNGAGPDDGADETDESESDESQVI